MNLMKNRKSLSRQQIKSMLSLVGLEVVRKGFSRNLQEFLPLGKWLDLTIALYPIPPL
jgi:p-aminobenzoyl-glutamate transporter AbgT